MKIFAVISLLTASVAANIAESCVDETLNQETKILSATCNNRAHEPVAASIDLNKCFHYQDGKIRVSVFKCSTDDGANDVLSQYEKDGNFGASCDDCVLRREIDDVFGRINIFINCVCDGQEADRAIGKFSGTEVNNRQELMLFNHRLQPLK